MKVVSQDKIYLSLNNKWKNWKNVAKHEDKKKEVWSIHQRSRLDSSIKRKKFTYLSWKKEALISLIQEHID